MVGIYVLSIRVVAVIVVKNMCVKGKMVREGLKKRWFVVIESYMKAT